MTKELLDRYLKEAYRMGQVFWQQADSEFVSQHKKADVTKAKFDQLLIDAGEALAQQEHLPDSEYARGFADGQKEFAEIAGGAWQIAVIDQLVIHHIYQSAHDTDPRKAINDLLCISNDIALDPQVSSDAQALIDRGRREAQQEQPAQEPIFYQYRWTNPGDNKDVPEYELDWKTVELRNPYTDTIESRIEELKSSRYNGKHCYEVRGLFAHPAPTQPALSLKKESK